MFGGSRCYHSVPQSVTLLYPNSLPDNCSTYFTICLSLFLVLFIGQWNTTRTIDFIYLVTVPPVDLSYFLGRILATRKVTTPSLLALLVRGHTFCLDSTYSGLTTGISDRSFIHNSDGSSDMQLCPVSQLDLKPVNANFRSKTDFTACPQCCTSQLEKLLSVVVLTSSVA